MLSFLQIEVNTLHQQKDYTSFYCDDLLRYSGTKPTISLRYACTLIKLIAISCNWLIALRFLRLFIYILKRLYRLVSLMNLDAKIPNKLLVN